MWWVHNCKTFCDSVQDVIFQVDNLRRENSNDFSVTPFMHCINAADNFDGIVLEFALYEEKKTRNISLSRRRENEINSIRYTAYF